MQITTNRLPSPSPSTSILKIRWNYYQPYSIKNKHREVWCWIARFANKTLADRSSWRDSSSSQFFEKPEKSASLSWYSRNPCATCGYGYHDGIYEIWEYGYQLAALLHPYEAVRRWIHHFAFFGFLQNLFAPLGNWVCSRLVRIPSGPTRADIRSSTCGHPQNKIQLCHRTGQSGSTSEGSGCYKRSHLGHSWRRSVGSKRHKSGDKSANIDATESLRRGRGYIWYCAGHTKCTLPPKASHHVPINVGRNTT